MRQHQRAGVPLLPLLVARECRQAPAGVDQTQRTVAEIATRNRVLQAPAGADAAADGPDFPLPRRAGLKNVFCVRIRHALAVQPFSFVR